MSEDAELMLRVRAGDQAALAALTERWELPVKAFLLRMVHNAAEADDIAQETFVRIWQQSGRFRPGAEFRPWLFAIAANLARNRLRWWRRRPTVALEEGTAADGAAENATGKAVLLKSERADAVRAAVNALPLDLKESLVLFEYGEMSHAEVAAALGCTLKAVESRLYRARALLRQSLRAWIEP